MYLPDSEYIRFFLKYFRVASWFPCSHQSVQAAALAIASPDCRSQSESTVGAEADLVIGGKAFTTLRTERWVRSVGCPAGGCSLVRLITVDLGVQVAVTTAVDARTSSGSIPFECCRLWGQCVCGDFPSVRDIRYFPNESRESCLNATKQSLSV